MHVKPTWLVGVDRFAWRVVGRRWWKIVESEERECSRPGAPYRPACSRSVTRLIIAGAGRDDIVLRCTNAVPLNR